VSGDRVLTRAHQDAIWRRTAAHHQLRSLLREFYPTFLAAFTDRFALGIASPMARAVLDQWLHPRRAAVAAIVRQAVADGELRDGTDVDVIVDALVSPPYYRLLFALSPLDDAALIDLLETVWRGCRRSDALP
jgi:Tetracyclin repressor-like, C-terminal domain